MGDTLKIEGSELDELVSQLAGTVGLLNSNFLSDAVADMVGDKNLAAQIRNFDTSWEARRYLLIEDLNWLKGAISTISSSFATLETNLSTALTSPSDGSARGSTNAKKS